MFIKRRKNKYYILTKRLLIGVCLRLLPQSEIMDTWRTETWLSKITCFMWQIWSEKASYWTGSTCGKNNETPGVICV